MVIRLAVIIADNINAEGSDGVRKRQIVAELRSCLPEKVDAEIEPLQYGLTPDGSDFLGGVASSDVILHHCGDSNKTDLPLFVRKFLAVQPRGIIVLFSGKVSDGQRLGRIELDHGSSCDLDHERIVVLNRRTLCSAVANCLAAVAETPPEHWDIAEITSRLLGGNPGEDAALQFFAGIATLDLWWLATGRDDREGLREAANQYRGEFSATADKSFERSVTLALVDAVCGPPCALPQGPDLQRLDQLIGAAKLTLMHGGAPIHDANDLINTLAAVPDRATWIAHFGAARRALLLN